MEVQKTALYNYHKDLGAKFVSFAGYEMPIQYKDGIVKEHISTRSYAGFFDVSHMGQFFLEGDETLVDALEISLNQSNSKIKNISRKLNELNFIGNANKFSKSKVFIGLKSDNNSTIVTIEDDGDGYPNDIISKIGEPYLRSAKSYNKDKMGLGLGLFIGKSLLEKNLATVNCWNSQTRSGAEVIIKWKNKDLFNL